MRARVVPISSFSVPPENGAPSAGGSGPYALKANTGLTPSDSRSFYQHDSRPPIIRGVWTVPDRQRTKYVFRAAEWESYYGDTPDDFVLQRVRPPHDVTFDGGCLDECR